MNAKQRARWLADLISETQRYLKQAHKRECPESKLVVKSLDSLRDARDIALSDQAPDSEPSDTSEK